MCVSELCVSVCVNVRCELRVSELCVSELCVSHAK